jgi:uncharacterized protein YecT (DUF1311 family)
MRTRYISVIDWAPKKRMAGFFLTLIASLGYAIDNPDAQDYVGSFKAKAEQHELAIGEQENNVKAADMRGRYDKFLDDELNSAYSALLLKLPPVQQQQLRESQRAWVRHRDLEVAFINANWAPDKFGSSSAMSRSAYRASLVRSRIEQLLGYLSNY